MILVKWLIMTLAIMVAAALLPGMRVRSFGTALLASLVLGIVNVLVRPLIILLTLPLTILTLGLFLFVINALMLQLAAAIVPGFEVRGFGSALLGSIVISLIGLLLGMGLA